MLAIVVKTWTRVWRGRGFKSSLGYLVKFSVYLKCWASDIFAPMMIIVKKNYHILEGNEVFYMLMDIKYNLPRTNNKQSLNSHSRLGKERLGLKLPFSSYALEFNKVVETVPKLLVLYKCIR